MQQPFNPWIRLTFGAILVFVAVGLVANDRRWIRSAFQGPVPITTGSLREVTDPAMLTNPWVSFSFNDSIDTELVMQSTKYGVSKIRSKYILIRISDRWLIAEVPANFTGNQVVGYLDKWWLPLRKQVMGQIKQRFPDHDLLPYQLDAEYAYKRECLLLLVIAGVFAVAGIAVMGLAWSGMGKLKRSDFGSTESGEPVSLERLSRAYRHVGCNSVTVVSGGDYVFLESPFHPVGGGTFCVTCQAYVPVSSVSWEDTGENVEAYRTRLYYSVPWTRRIYLAVFGNPFQGAPALRLDKNGQPLPPDTE